MRNFFEDDDDQEKEYSKECEVENERLEEGLSNDVEEAENNMKSDGDDIDDVDSENNDYQKENIDQEGAKMEDTKK